ncbi:MAG TPA: hypothetical protein VFW30_08075 [Bryocella sp.]|nr:hypothetical protein [Bryocella sp.]
MAIDVTKRNPEYEDVAPQGKNDFVGGGLAPDLAAVELEEEIGRTEARLEGARTRYKTALAMSFGLMAVLWVGGYLWARAQSTRSASLIEALCLVYGMAVPIGVSVAGQGPVSRNSQQLAALQARKRVASRFVEQDGRKGDDSYFDSLVKINVENLAEYYELVKSHTDKSFSVSVGAGIIGFLLIVTGLTLSFIQVGPGHVPGITEGAGIITEFISAVFFYLYNKTVASMKGYHDSLLAVQNILLSFKLVGDTEAAPEAKARMVEQMLEYLIGNRHRPSSKFDSRREPRHQRNGESPAMAANR